MAKRRRSSKKPNLPQSTLERARRQAEGEDVPVEETTSKAEEAPKEAAPDKTKSAESSPRRRKVSPVQLERSRQRGELSNEMIEELLHNPTVEVSQQELGSEYRHVLVDLRNMGALAAVLFVVLVLMAQFI